MEVIYNDGGGHAFAVLNDRDTGIRGRDPAHPDQPVDWEAALDQVAADSRVVRVRLIEIGPDGRPRSTRPSRPNDNWRPDATLHGVPGRGPPGQNGEEPQDVRAVLIRASQRLGIRSPPPGPLRGCCI